MWLRTMRDWWDSMKPEDLKRVSKYDEWRERMSL